MLIWTTAWVYETPDFEWRSRVADVKVGCALLTGNKSIASRENIEYGYSVFILAAQKLFGRDISASHDYETLYSIAKKEWKKPTIFLLYIAFLFSFILSWFAVLRKTDVKTANWTIVVLILYLFTIRNITFTLLSEPLYFALILIIFSLVVIGFNSKKNYVFCLLGITVIYANELRPFPMYGIAAPLFFYLLWKYWSERETLVLYNLGAFISGMIICKLIMFLIIGYAFNFDPPKRSDAYNITLRVLHMDGICLRSNGPACRKLMDIDKGISPDKHKEGWINANKETYRYVFKNDGVEEMDKLYFQAAKECVVAYPFISIRNSALNILSFFSLEHLLYLQSRRETDLSYWPMNPEEWSNPSRILLSSVINNLKYPFWILLFIILMSKRIRNNMDPSLIILLSFCAAHILIPSIAGRYLPRFSTPMFVAAFIPFAVTLGKRYSYYLWFMGSAFLIFIITRVIARLLLFFN